MSYTRLLVHKIEALERSQAVIEFALDGTVLRANGAFLELMGYTEQEVVGQHHAIFVNPEESAGAEYGAFWEHLRSGEFSVGEFRRLDKFHRPVWIHGVYCPLLDDQGRPYRVMKFAADVTAKKRRDAYFEGQIAAIRESQAVVEFTPDGTIIDANRNFLDLLGYRLEDIKGYHHAMLVEPAQRDTPEYRAFWAQLRDGNYHSALYRRIDSQGKVHWIQASYNPVRDENGSVTKIVKFATDQTEAIEDHLRVKYLSLHDTLTGLPNRAALHRAIEDELARRPASAPKMLLLDLDCFKQINDCHGHAAGDICLTVVAQRLKQSVPDAICAARLGGDEFAVLLDGKADAEAVAATIVKAVQVPFRWEGLTQSVGASIGISLPGTNASELLRQADIALYAAKAAGRATWRVFAPEMAPTGVNDHAPSIKLSGHRQRLATNTA